jgi:formate dehydrogenase major subunit
VPGLGTSFGRGGATTAQQDLANADAILIMGSSMAENHPVGFQWVIEAREKNGAKVIHVDPRFNRTSAMADYWLPLRAGSDLAFLGAMIRYVIENDRVFREYVVRYTNAATILRSDFKDTEDLDGLFSDSETWFYDRAGKDETLQHPRCVFQVLKRHFARYTPELVEQLCGIPRERFLEVADVFTRASGPDKTAAICYAVGWTQHSTGVQIIRAAAILQMLLGNIGRPGGGILALRGHASIQGSTDIPTLYDILPGYLPMPMSGLTLRDYIAKHSSPKGWWYNLDKYIVSLLKAYYGDAATKANDFGFDWLPRLTGDHSYFGYWTDMKDGKLEGLFVFGQNPAVGSPNGKFERAALAKLKWLVVRDMVETETASFWKDAPEVVNPEDFETEVFLLPAASYAEKDGAFTNTQRMLQWHEKSVDPPGDANSDLQFMIELGRMMKQRATDAPRDAPLRALTWDYEDDDADAVLREIHGWKNDERGTMNDEQRRDVHRSSFIVHRSRIKNFSELKADGTTSSGCWIYSGVYDGENKANKREPRGRYGHGWGFAWPLDRRILYNRCSAKPDGTPWSERKKLIWWDEAKGEWGGDDVPDFTKTKRPDYPGDEDKNGDEALPGDAPFIMHSDGAGWLWVPSGLKDGPLPAYYEPLETNVRNPLYSQQQNPAADKMERPDNPYASSPDPRFPHVLTTYRLTEHHTAGGMSRTLSHLAELQPELFTEISPELAESIGAANGDRVTISTARGSIEARALVTTRMPSLTIDGRRMHQVGLPYHFGYRGLVTGGIANDLLAISEEPNVRIFESKGLSCSVERAE